MELIFVVVACDKRKALRKGATATKQSSLHESWIASLTLAMTARALGSVPSPLSHPPASRQQHDAGRGRDNPMLEVNPCYAGFMSGEEGRQLVRGKNEIEAGDDEKQDADKRENDFHEIVLEWCSASRSA
jgi:hypothetical protein